MNEGGAGTTLIEDECNDACDTAATEALNPAALPNDDAKERHDALEEARKKEEEETKAREEEERRKAEEDEKRTEELKKIDERLVEIDRRTAELEKEIEAEEAEFRKSVEELKGMSTAEKQQILDNNLPNQARKERAELEKLKSEKAALEGKKAGLQE
jgi:hypothetical protein